MRKSLRRLLIASLLAAACGAPPKDSEPRTAGTPGRAGASGGSVAHRDPRLGTPSFVWLSGDDLPAFSDAREAASGVLDRVASVFELEPGMRETLGELAIDAHGPVVARFRQHVRGIEVFRGGVSIAMTAKNEAIAASGMLAPSLEGSERPFVLEPSDVVARAVAIAGGLASSRPVSAIAPLHGYERFVEPALSRPARVKRVLFPRRDRSEGKVVLEPAHYVEVALAGGPARSFVVSAIDGRVLLSNDLVRHDAYSYRVYADPTSFMPFDGPQGNGFAPHPTSFPDGAKLSYVSSEVVTLANYPFSKNDPWLPPGATTTDGNNVVAYADLAAPDGYFEGSDVRPALTAAATFGASYDTASAPDATTASIQAATQHLFYVTNFLHDWFYDSGFDEAAGNHQLDNFGRGGRGLDPLRAEAQDNSGRNNANAQVPADGDSPIVQMYVFSGPSDAYLSVNTPSPLAGRKNAGIASGFGKDVFDVTADVVLADDGAGADVADACEALSADLAGKIVLIHRGTCSFVQKAQNAQAAGASGCIIANVPSSARATVAPFMGGTASGISIPILSLDVSNGQALEGAVATGANVTMHRSVGVDLDGALDTSIVAHEWGHVLSGRLISDGAGLTTNQSGGLGEGWGDFTALLLAVRPDEVHDYWGTYANGAYATSGSGDDIYFGTRRVPYSIDFSRNALTFKHIQNGVPLPPVVATSFGEDGSFNSEVHSTGEVWATMLFECYALLLRERGLSFADAQARMKRYLVASLELTPPDPTLLEARDAVLAAAFANDEEDFRIFWKAFAIRGAGAGATGPAKDSPNNGPVVESYWSGNDVEIDDAKVDDDAVSCDHDGLLDEGETGTLTLTLRNAGSGTVAKTMARATSKTPGVTFDRAETPLPTLAPFATTKLQIKTSISGVTPVDVVDLDVTLADDSFAKGRTVSVTVPTRFQADEAPDASAIDRVDTKRTAWKRTREWARASEGRETFWSVPDGIDAGDHFLTSPAFTIDDTTFSLSFKHRYSFRFSTRRHVDIDGGVVELSTDGGKSWSDISKYGDIDYNSRLSAVGRGDNPLSGRKAFGNKSAGYPDRWVDSKIEVTLPEHPESVRIRFRLGTGTGFRPSDGWNIDDITLEGISSTPFYAFVPHVDECDPDAPVVNAGPSKTAPANATVTLDGSASSAKDLPLTYLWKQVEGSEVALEGASGPTPSLVVPSVPPGTKLAFDLRAHDGKLLSTASRVEVVVTAVDASASGSGCSTTTSRGSEAGGAALAALALAFVRGRRRRRA